MTPNDFKNDYLSFNGTGFSISPIFTQSAGLDSIINLKTLRIFTLLEQAVIQVLEFQE